MDTGEHLSVKGNIYKSFKTLGWIFLIITTSVPIILTAVTGDWFYFDYNLLPIAWSGLAIENIIFTCLLLYRKVKIGWLVILLLFIGNFSQVALSVILLVTHSRITTLPLLISTCVTSGASLFSRFPILTRLLASFAPSLERERWH
jgi:hypothetical protein